MKNTITCTIAFALLFLITQCTPAPKGFKIRFDRDKEVSGQKFAIRDINPSLPRD